MCGSSDFTLQVAHEGTTADAENVSECEDSKELGRTQELALS